MNSVEQGPATVVGGLVRRRSILPRPAARPRTHSTQWLPREEASERF